MTSETKTRPLYIVYDYLGKGTLPGSGRTVLMVTQNIDAGDELSFEEIQALETRAAARVAGGVRDGKLFLTWWRWLRPDDGSIATPETAP